MPKDVKLRKLPKTAEEAARLVLELLKHRGTITDATNKANDFIINRSLKGATLDQMMTITGALAFTSGTERWFRFRRYWDVEALKKRFGESFDMECYVDNVLWLVDLLVTNGKPGAAYDVLKDVVADVALLRGAQLTALFERLAEFDNFQHYTKLLNDKLAALQL